LQKIPAPHPEVWPDDCAFLPAADGLKFSKKANKNTMQRKAKTNTARKSLRQFSLDLHFLKTEFYFWMCNGVWRKFAKRILPIFSSSIFEVRTEVSILLTCKTVDCFLKHSTHPHIITLD